MRWEQCRAGSRLNLRQIRSLCKKNRRHLVAFPATSPGFPPVLSKRTVFVERSSCLPPSGVVLFSVCFRSLVHVKPVCWLMSSLFAGSVNTTAPPPPLPAPLHIVTPPVSRPSLLRVTPIPGTIIPHISPSCLSTNAHRIALLTYAEVRYC